VIRKNGKTSAEGKGEWGRWKMEEIIDRTSDK
jgi:hypothetical protein